MLPFGNNELTDQKQHRKEIKYLLIPPKKEASRRGSVTICGNRVSCTGLSTASGGNLASIRIDISHKRHQSFGPAYQADTLIAAHLHVAGGAHCFPIKERDKRLPRPMAPQPPAPALPVPALRPQQHQPQCALYLLPPLRRDPGATIKSCEWDLTCLSVPSSAGKRLVEALTTWRDCFRRAARAVLLCLSKRKRWRLLCGGCCPSLLQPRSLPAVFGCWLGSSFGPISWGEIGCGLPA